MTRRPLLLLPFIALLSAATAACGSASPDTPAGPVTSTAAAAAAAPASAKHHAVTPQATKTVTVTSTVAARPTRPRSTPVPTASAPSFAAFAGDWSGHTKFVSVSRTGRLEEHVGDGCCHPVVDMVIQLSDPHRAGKAWVANGRVVSAEVHDGWDTSQRAPKPGDRTVVKVGADHILTESITGYVFCDPDKTAPGTCGA
jgi:hypothetical protein